jgi:DNA-binding NarL/FixJ family response regulator
MRTADRGEGAPEGRTAPYPFPRQDVRVGSRITTGAPRATEERAVPETADTADAGGVDPPAEPIGVFLLDDHEVVRRGLRDLLDAEPDLTVVGEAASAREAIARAPAVRPRVAVLDVRLGGAGEGADHEGIAVCRELRARLPELACLMLTSFDDDEALFDAIMAGAAGYVLKQINGSDLVSAVRTVAGGRSMLDPGATARVMARLRGPQPSVPDELERLSPRERETLELIGDGLTNRQIAERLFLAEKTVKNRISSILSKLGVGRRIQAAVIAERIRERETGQ